MSAYWPPLENLPTFDVTVFRDAQDVVDYAVATGTANNIVGGTAGALLYQSAPSTTAKLPIGTNTYVLTSNGSIPTWTAPSVPSTPTLANVLLAGNSAGSTSINMNSQSITNANAVTATTFNGALNGNANTATTATQANQVNITRNNTNNAFALVFAVGIGTGYNGLQYDDSTVPLTYNPFTNTLVCANVTASLNGTADIALRANTIDITTLPSASAFYYLNYVATSTTATSQTVYTNSQFYLNPASGILAGGTINLFGGFANVSSTAGARAINNTFYNLMDNTAVAGGTNRGNLTTTSTLASLNLTSATHQFSITNNSGALTPFLISPSILTITTTINPTITGYTDPAASDSTNNVATTRWVQSAITAAIPSAPTLSAVLLVGNSAGSTSINMNSQNITNATSITATTFNGALNGSASAVALTSDDTATTCYIPFSKTTSATSNILYIDDVTTPLRYRPDTGEISSTRVSVGGILNPSAGDIATRFLQFTGANSVFEVRNQATAGRIRLVTLDGTNTAINVVTLSTTDFTTITTNNPTITGFTDPATSDSTSKIATTRWVQSVVSGGGAASTIAVADDNSATTMYPVFTTATAGQKSLLFDSTTTPLRYKPSTSEMSALQFSVGGILEPVAGDNAGFIAQNIGSSATVVQNQATSGQIHLVVRDSGNLLKIPFKVSSDDVSGFQFSVGNIVNPVAGDNAGFIAQNTGSSATVVQNQATSGEIHLVVRDSGNLLKIPFKVSSEDVSGFQFSVGNIVNPVAGNNAGFIAQNTSSSATVLQNQATSGVIHLITRNALSNPNIVLQISSTNLTTTTTNNPTITGFTDPATSDSTSKIATTRWVQSALTSGAAYIKSTITTTGVYYLVGSTSQPTSNDSTLYKSDTGTGVYVNAATNIIICDGIGAKNNNGDFFTYNFETPTSVNFILVNNATSAPGSNKTIFKNINSAGTTRTTLTLDGNAGASTFDGLSAASTTVAVAVDNSATTMYPIFATTGAGQKSLLFDTTSTALSYTPSTSTLRAFVYSIDPLGRYELPTTIPSSIAGVGTDIAVNNANIGGDFEITVATSTVPKLCFSTRETATAIYNPTIVAVGTGASNTRAFNVTESGGVGVSMLPNSTVGSYNPLIAVNDSVIFADNTAINTSDLVLTTWSATTAGVRITPTTALIGAGGTSATPTASVSCSGTTVTVAGDPDVINRNIRVDTGGSAITMGNGASTATANIILTKLSLASTRDFTTGGNTIIGAVAGNALVVASTRNTFVGDSAGASATGNNNICIGYNSQVPTAASNNQIAIGTASETMYVRGGFNWRVGAQITSTATGNLATAVLAQFYTVAMSTTGQTIALPNPATAAYLGARVTFKRKTNTTVFTITSTGGAGFVPIASTTLSASPISIAATVFQVDLVCDGTNWCIIGQA